MSFFVVKRDLPGVTPEALQSAGIRAKVLQEAPENSYGARGKRFGKSRQLWLKYLAPHVGAPVVEVNDYMCVGLISYRTGERYYTQLTLDHIVRR